MAFSTDNQSEDNEYYEFLQKYAQDSKSETTNEARVGAAQSRKGSENSPVEKTSPPQRKVPMNSSESKSPHGNKGTQERGDTKSNQDNTSSDMPAVAGNSQSSTSPQRAAEIKSEKSTKTGVIIGAFVVILLFVCCGIIIHKEANCPTANIVFLNSQYELTVGESTELAVEILPEKAKNQQYYFKSSDEEVVEIYGHVVTAKKSGIALVTVFQDDMQYSQCVVKVNDIEPTNISVDSSEQYTCLIGRPFDLPIVYEPKNTTDFHLLITVKDPAVAEVRDGKIVGLQRGSTEVHVVHQATSLSVSFSISVEPVELNAVKIDMPTSIKIGDEIPLSCRFDPVDATDQTVKWSSSSSCAVIQDGKLLAKREGKTTLKVIHSNKIQDSIEVVISEVPVEAVNITLANSIIEVGESKTIAVTFSPPNSTNVNISWSSSNNSVA